MNLAPIVLFAYNRPELLRETLDSLSRNPLAAESVLTVFADGPKSGATEEQLHRIEQVREVVKERPWCREVQLIAAESNKGLAQSVIQGVSQTLATSDRVIVIEDDVQLSPHFLQFMNASLEQFKNDERVLSIGSWNYFADPKALGGNFFLRYPDSIAWATFARAWQLFEPDGAKLLRELRQQKTLDTFNADGRLSYFEAMLNQQIEGKIDSWAIRWTATSVLNKKLNYYPRVSLSKHLGFTSDATHENNSSDYNADLRLAEEAILPGQEKVEENKMAFRSWRKFIEQLMGITLSSKIKSKIKDIMPSKLLSAYQQRKKS